MVTSQGAGLAMSGCYSESLKTTEKPCTERNLQIPATVTFLTEPPGPLWATANVRTSTASSKDTQRLSLHISFSQLLKVRTEVLGLVMMALELLGQQGELLL